MLAVHHLEGEVINSVLIACKPFPIARVVHTHGHGTVLSQPCLCCDMEAQVHQKMQEVAMEQLSS